VLAALLILLVYALFCGDVWLAPRFRPEYAYYWYASAAIALLYWLVLPPHGERWRRYEERLRNSVASWVRQFGGERRVIAFGSAVIYAAALMDAAYRVQRIRHSPINVVEGDMLPLIQAAVRTFLHGGNPYREYHVPWELHLTYYPGLWLAYVPAELLHLDYRWIGVAAILGVAVVFVATMRWACLRMALHDRGAGIGFACSTVLLACAFLLNNKSRWFTPAMHTPPLWLYLTLFCALALARRNVAASVLLGLCCAARISFFVLAPFWLLYLWRTQRTNFARRALQFCAPVVLLLVPFIVAAPREFFFGTVQWYWISSARAWQLLPASMLATFGITSPLYAAGGVRWIPVLQIVLLAVIAAVAWWRVRDLRGAMAAMSWALLAFSFTALVPYTYIFLECFLLLSFAALEQMLPREGFAQ
jgi:hypothetical protein